MAFFRLQCLLFRLVFVSLKKIENDKEYIRKSANFYNNKYFINNFHKNNFYASKKRNDEF